MAQCVAGDLVGIESCARGHLTEDGPLLALVRRQPARAVPLEEKWRVARPVAAEFVEYRSQARRDRYRNLLALFLAATFVRRRHQQPRIRAISLPVVAGEPRRLRDARAG